MSWRREFVTSPYRHEYDRSHVDDARQSPMGVTVLSFEIEVTGAALQPNDSSKQPVSTLSEPEDIELEHLQTESALWRARVFPQGRTTASWSRLTTLK